MQCNIFAVLTFYSSYHVAADSCNGNPDFCGLRFDQVTLAGSHSAGAGSTGSILDCNGQVINDCIYQSQNLSITAQLDLGIRFLSLDLCVLPSECATTPFGDVGADRLMSCRGDINEDASNYAGLGYGQSLLRTLRDIDQWMRANPQEVIGLRFTGEVNTGDSAGVVNALVPTLIEMWGEGTSNVTTRGNDASATEMSFFYSANNYTWPTLEEAIEENRRIFVFIDDSDLYAGGEETPWLSPTPALNADVQTWDQRCNDMTGFGAECADTGVDEYYISVGYTLAICIFTGVANCEPFIRNTTEACYRHREDVNRTVNVLLVDYPQLTTTNNSVFSIVADLNVENVWRFAEPELATTATPMTDEIISTPGNETSGTVSTFVTPFSSTFVTPGVYSSPLYSSAIFVTLTTVVLFTQFMCLSFSFVLV